MPIPPFTPGTLDLLVLQTLKSRRLHGYAIARRLEELSSSALSVEEGTLYPALHRMERRGWLASEWDRTDTGRRARFYTLTDEGVRHLRAERKEWKSRSLLIGRILGIELT